MLMQYHMIATPNVDIQRPLVTFAHRPLTACLCELEIKIKVSTKSQKTKNNLKTIEAEILKIALLTSSLGPQN